MQLENYVIQYATYHCPVLNQRITVAVKIHNEDLEYGATAESEIECSYDEYRSYLYDDIHKPLGEIFYENGIDIITPVEIDEKSTTLWFNDVLEEWQVEQNVTSMNVNFLSSMEKSKSEDK